MKNKQVIDALLNKYFNGETTLEEEGVIRDYFRGGETSEDHLPYAPLFAYFEEQQSVQPQRRVVVRRKSEAKVNPLQFSGKLLKYAAVAVLLVVCIFFFTQQKEELADQGYVAYEDTFTNPEDALEATRGALGYLSQKMNPGIAKISHVQELKPMYHFIPYDK